MSNQEADSLSGLTEEAKWPKKFSEAGIDSSLQMLFREKVKKKEEPEEYARQLALRDLAEKIEGIKKVKEVVHPENFIFTYWSDKGPAYSVYDKSGEWVGTLSILNNDQLPARTRKVIKDLDMEITDFQDKIKLETRDIQRPVVALLTSERNVVNHESLTVEEKKISEHLLAGVNISGQGEHIVLGEEIEQLAFDRIAFVGMVVSADGYPASERDIRKLLENDIMIFPRHYDARPWAPSLGKGPDSGQNWFLMTQWDMPYQDWYPQQEWFVDGAW